jgi:hypothetical protein
MTGVTPIGRVLKSPDRPQVSIIGPVTDLGAVLEAAVDCVAEVEPDEDARQTILLRRLSQAPVGPRDRRRIGARFPGWQGSAARLKPDPIGPEDLGHDPGGYGPLDRVGRVMVGNASVPRRC